ncbi:motility associated factor glycosyltransferase family protein [Priestia koreensis]|uniref:motility associated factor glycosyltransferase family protein n=1 Tax=Priestia koreensis TaxID=284581 RepID=UPI001F5622F6|nr:6-hydroxymethylpterin diphosphokinase MptE-like protein [Priestia koreensis]UNL84780.1 motility associated factor glycosyltransferase family protein [Priestia koreensis]
MRFSIIKTKTAPTVKVESEASSFFLHSSYDPLKEAQKWVTEKMKSGHTLLVIGMGAGYHVEELLNTNNSAQIIVYEFNVSYYKWILSTGLIEGVIRNPRVKYKLLESKEDVREFSSLLNNHIYLLRPSLNMVEEKYMKIMREIQSYLITQDTIENYAVTLDANFLKNVALGDPFFKECNFSFKKRMILVSAGPSLYKQLDNLKKAQKSGSFTIGVVGTAFRPLLKHGLYPDFVMVSDPLDNIIEQFEDLNNENIPLFYLSTANSKAIFNYQGPRYIVWQKGYKNAEQEAAIRGQTLIETGGSVATCLLDVMITMGAEQVALVGQDLAFTNNQSHVEGAHRTRIVHETPNLLKVRSFDGVSTVSTSRNLFTYLRWFEGYAESKVNIELWNCTEGGAFIRGFKNSKFKDFLKFN